MRRVLLCCGGLLLACAAVFFAVYFGGRRPSLEEELARLRRGPAVAPSRERGIPSLKVPEAPPPPPASEAEEVEQTAAEGIVVTRSPRPEPALAVVLDLEAVAAGYRDTIASFFAQPPVGASVAVRSLAGVRWDCERTTRLRPSGPWAPDELLAALDGGLAVERGGRNPARAVEEAVADLGEAAGERAVVVVAGGGDACGLDLCAAGAAGGAAVARVHAVLLVPPPGPAGEDLPAEVPAEPAWIEGYRCLAERTGGTVSVVSSPGELGRRLRLIGQGLEASLLVRAFHGRGAELRGIAPDGFEWGASLAARGAVGEEGAVRLSPEMPAAFALPAGTWDLSCQYNGLLRQAPVAVGPGEQVEVRVTFPTGELYVEAHDAAGGEIAGDSGGFGCLWGAEVLPEGAEEPMAVTCVLPAQIELPAGAYRVRVRWKDRERMLEAVAVEAGGTAVRSVDFAAQGD